jgi:hypothetical protein
MASMQNRSLGRVSVPMNDQRGRRCTQGSIMSQLRAGPGQLPVVTEHF